LKGIEENVFNHERKRKREHGRHGKDGYHGRKRKKMKGKTINGID
jgi:hypothetical protein